MVNASANVIGSNTYIDIAAVLDSMQAGLEAMGVGELLGLVLETYIVSLCMTAITVCITIIIYGRMIEIYLYTSLAPIPFATFTNKERLIYKGGQANTPNILSANGSFATV